MPLRRQGAGIGGFFSFIRPEGPEERIVRLRREKDSLLLLFQALKKRLCKKRERLQKKENKNDSKIPFVYGGNSVFFMGFGLRQ